MDKAPSEPGVQTHAAPPRHGNDASNRDPGVAFEELKSLPLSATLRRVIETARDRAASERFSGFLGTGLFLFALEAVGRAQTNDPSSAAARLAAMINRLGGANFSAERKRFFDASRLPEGQRGRRPDRMSTSLRGVFREAANLPQHDGILAARHLVVALLRHQPEGRDRPTKAWKILASAGIDRRILLGEFVAELARTGAAEERTRWQEIAAQNPIPVRPPPAASPESPPVPAPPFVAGFGADVPSGRATDDCLNLDASVNAIAHLIASPQLEGNLSLGVFGNWGSGKSFFMRRLRGAIDELSARGQAEARADPTVCPPYWPNIAQIEFNAWHYVDANLWASLMSTLLQELRRWDPAAATLAAQTPLQSALENLPVASAAHAEAVRVERLARDARSAAETALENARQHCDFKATRLADETRRSLWSFIEERFEPERAQVAEQLARLGVASDAARDSLQVVHAQLKDLSTTGGRLHAVVLGVIRAPDRARQLRLLALIVGLPLGVLLVLSFTPLGERLATAGVWFVTTLATLATAAAKAASWLRLHVDKVLAALAPLNAVRGRIEAALAGAETEKAARLAGLEQDLADSRAALTSASVVVATREKELLAAIESVGDAVSGRAISQFIERRVASGDYQKHLGLIALIREDFEQLSDLMRAHNALRLQLPDEASGIEAALRRARPELANTDLHALFAHLGVNRVVLYIDDLDRCPSERVVEVLQAIHLLLAFPVFVVIVGVDSRWMAHSLAKEYPALLARSRKRDQKLLLWSREEGLAPVTAADYLEKIFQIPFWVPPLNGTSASLLIGKLTEPKPDPTRPAPRVPPGATNLPPANIAEDPTEVRAADAADVADQPRGSSHNGDGPSGPAPTQSSPANRAHGNDAGSKPVPLPPPRPESLALSEAERQAMQSLAHLAGRSPRATKRFVNSYRLLKAALTDPERAKLGVTDTTFGQLAIPMFMLAVVTGVPTFARRFLHDQDPAAPGLLLERLRWLASSASSDPAHIEAAIRIHRFYESPAERALWAGLTTAEMRTWASRVAQFSFQELTFSVSDQPGPSDPAAPATGTN